jgi:hypothetical protein
MTYPKDSMAPEYRTPNTVSDTDSSGRPETPRAKMTALNRPITTTTATVGDTSQSTGNPR